MEELIEGLTLCRGLSLERKENGILRHCIRKKIFVTESQMNTQIINQV